MWTRRGRATRTRSFHVEPTAADAETGQPIGRLERGDEIVAAVLWLCSPGASFVHGVALPVVGAPPTASSSDTAEVDGRHPSSWSAASSAASVGGIPALVKGHVQTPELVGRTVDECRDLVLATIATWPLKS